MSIVYLIVIDKYKILFKHKDKIISSFVSLMITLFVFELLSWYHFGDIPTLIVLLRLIIGFILIETLVYLIYRLIKKQKKIRGKIIWNL